MYSFPNLESVCCSMSSSNCCFLTCIQISQEAGQGVWYSHLFKNFPPFVVIHIVKGFGIVNKAEVDVFLELSCFFADPVDVGNLISGSPMFSITSWQTNGEKVEIVIDFTLGGSQIIADGDFSHEIKRHLLLGRKATASLGRVLKSRDITLLTKVHVVKAMAFPVVMYTCESWTIKKVEHGRIDAFKLWCWRRLFRIP